MIQGKLIRVLGYYNDASYIERIAANFRKLLIDIDWLYGRRLNDEGLYEVLMLVRDHPNFDYAILNLSKTVGIEKVEVFNYYVVKTISAEDSCVEKHCPDPLFVIYIPIYSRVITYSWGRIDGEDIS